MSSSLPQRPFQPQAEQKAAGPEGPDFGILSFLIQFASEIDNTPSELFCITRREGVGGAGTEQLVSVQPCFASGGGLSPAPLPAAWGGALLVGPRRNNRVSSATVMQGPLPIQRGTPLMTSPSLQAPPPPGRQAGS